MSTATADIKNLLGLEAYRPPAFYASLKDIESDKSRQPYAHVMRRAWQALKLSAILCIDGRPTVYIKEVQRPNKNQLREWHRKFWNQGTATILIVLTPSDALVFSALAYPARPDEDPKDGGPLVITLNRASQALELRALIHEIETGSFYSHHEESFAANRNVDEYLLNNLRATRDSLLQPDDGWDYQAVHSLLVRIIFTCYLVDRQVIGSQQFQEAGAPDAEKLQDVFNLSNATKIRSIISKLFVNLRHTFNGSIFGDEDSADPELSREQIAVLKNFLNGEELRKRQQTFGFWVYDFSVIPIETISSIYEEFLAAEDQEAQRTTGAYYTRRHLAETVVDTATEGILDLHTKRCLDPACGSGVFLVILFNRMAESWRRQNPGVRNATRAKALIELLQEQLCGVDIKETACRITCFSLYLALLDQLQPRDIHELEEHGTVLPDILALKRKGFQTTGNPPVVFEGSFFAEEVPVPRDFDLVVGNPPWVSRGRSKDETALAWCNSDDNPYLDDAPRAEAQRIAWFRPSKQIAHTFMWKVPLHLRKGGSACLLLPSKLLLNHETNRFQEAWFSRHWVDEVIQLADLRFILFQNAICPATIVRFKKGAEEDNQFQFIAPKASRDDPRADVITVRPEDIKTLSVADMVSAAESKAAPVLWKQALWGSPRDLQLMDRLAAFPGLSKIAGRPAEQKRWVKGQGFKPASDLTDRPKPIWWESDDLFVKARNCGIRLVLTQSECEPVGDRFEELSHTPYPRLFKPPLVLVSQGFGKLAYCDFPVLFQDSLQSIAGPREDAPLLKFLAAVLGSQLAKYYLFHTAANWGTERDKVHLFELLRMPFPLPEDTDNPKRAAEIVNEATAIVDRVAAKLGSTGFDHETLLQAAYEDIDPLVYEYYDLTDREVMLVEDTVQIIEPSSTPPSKLADIPTLRTPNQNERRLYAETLCHVLNEWASRGKWQVNASAELVSSAGLALLTLERATDSRPYTEQTSSDSLAGALKRLRKSLKERRGGLHHLLGLKVFDGPQIHILKPLRLRDWSRTTALNDADEIAAAILSPPENQ